MKNYCVHPKLHSDFVICLMYVQTTFLTLVLRLHTSNFLVPVPRRACKWARHEILRVPGGLRAHPQNDIVFLEGGCAPFTPHSKCEHICLNNIYTVMITDRHFSKSQFVLHIDAKFRFYNIIYKNNAIKGIKSSKNVLEADGKK